jgi:predicted nucleotidyltransferase
MPDIQLIVKAIKETLNPEKIILFGSYSRGEQTKDSDIDLAVIKKSPYKLGQRAKVSRYLINVGYDWTISPDIHIFSEREFNQRLKNNSLFIREIMKGKTIYAV